MHKGLVYISEFGRVGCSDKLVKLDVFFRNFKKKKKKYMNHNILTLMSSLNQNLELYIFFKLNKNFIFKKAVLPDFFSSHD